MPPQEPADIDDWDDLDEAAEDVLGPHDDLTDDGLPDPLDPLAEDDDDDFGGPVELGDDLSDGDDFDDPLDEAPIDEPHDDLWADIPIVLPWSCEISLNGARCAAVLDPTRATSTLTRPGATGAVEAVQLLLGPFTVDLAIPAIDGPRLLIALGRDALASRVLVSSSEKVP